MLQRSDEIYIARIVSPLPFRLVEGRVVVELPDASDRNSGTEKQSYGTIFTHDAIEKRVQVMKRIEKRSEMASNFKGHLLILDQILLQHRQYAGDVPADVLKSDPEVGPWIVWRDALLAQCEIVDRPADVKIPKWPQFPNWHRQSKDLQQLATRLGHFGPFQS